MQKHQPIKREKIPRAAQASIDLVIWVLASQVAVIKQAKGTEKLAWTRQRAAMLHLTTKRKMRMMQAWPIYYKWTINRKSKRVVEAAVANAAKEKEKGK